MRLNVIEQDGNSIWFVGMVRGVDELGHHAYAIRFAERQMPLYGEWSPLFLPDGHTFSICVEGFGFDDPRILGSSHPRGRASVLRREIDIARELILKIFADEDARASLFPFSSKKAIFTGEVSFSEGWAKETGAPAV